MTIMVPTHRSRLMNPFMSNPFEGFDFFMPNPAPPRGRNSAMQCMRADIKESAEAFELAIDLPGFKKENVTATLDEGYLTIKASMESEKVEDSSDEASESPKPSFTYLRKERFSGACSRTFFVGEDIEEDDVQAKFADGVLFITVPKKIEQPKLESSRSIAIA